MVLLDPRGKKSAGGDRAKKEEGWRAGNCPKGKNAEVAETRRAGGEEQERFRGEKKWTIYKK